MLALYIAVGVLLIGVLIGLFSGFTVPPEFTTGYNFIMEWVQKGLAILNVFVPLTYVRIFLAAWFTVYGIYHGYKIIMWALAKIPTFSGR